MFGQGKIIVIPIAIIIVFTFIVPLQAFAVGYYGSVDSGRPPSAFSICCCKKFSEDNIQTQYTCNLYEESSCPEKTKLYPGQAFDCPSSLIFTNYKSKE